jgi:hypothetical protein
MNISIRWDFYQEKYQHRSAEAQTDKVTMNREAPRLGESQELVNRPCQKEEIEIYSEPAAKEPASFFVRATSVAYWEQVGSLSW